MTRTPRTSNAPVYVAVALSLLALVVAATTTAYAAGLAKNSVGTKQLKKDAVTAVKIKANAVTSSEIADGSVTGADVKAGLLQTKPTFLSVDLPATAAAASTILVAGGLTFDAACQLGGLDNIYVKVTRTGGGLLSYSGGYVEYSTNLDPLTYPVLEVDVTNYQQSPVAPADGMSSLRTLDATFVPAGKPAVLVQLTTRVDDNATPACRVRITVSPTQ